MSKQDILKVVDIEYTKCFSESLEDSCTFKFRDEKLRDMYMHNFMYTKEQVDLDVFKQLFDIYK
ncbi:hypothetical protein [Candidatus Albibeggiatoa sp. nov. NOAA]|uniref:hypothetical protein n=1 Tax=Candidatus Albibeggiatoa sp. nov. NOAA TaxID=3162724 RepID=UPI0032F23169|nr:hypothetical protein [Thiotrichaceae bacterium]